MSRCVVIGGADIGNYDRLRSYLRPDDFLIYCDSGLKHMEGLGMRPSLIVGDFDSHDDPNMDIETIVLPVAKDDTDSVYAVREGKKRGYTDFLLIGVYGARIDHTLVNLYVLFDLDTCGMKALAVDDYSELSVVSDKSGPAFVEDRYPYFSLLNMTGVARGVIIRNAKFTLEEAEIKPDYQYATSNEVLPGEIAEISVADGRLLLIKDF